VKTKHLDSIKEKEKLKLRRKFLFVMATIANIKEEKKIKKLDLKLILE